MKCFEMDETELICVGVIPEISTRLVVIDFLSTSPIKETERKTSIGLLPNGDTTAWRFTLVKEIKETFT